MNYQACELEEAGSDADPHRRDNHVCGFPACSCKPGAQCPVVLGNESRQWDLEHGCYDGGIAWAPILVGLGIMAALIVGAIYFL